MWQHTLASLSLKVMQLGGRFIENSSRINNEIYSSVTFQMFNAIVTYMLILVQFAVSEKEQQ